MIRFIVDTGDKVSSFTPGGIENDAAMPDFPSDIDEPWFQDRLGKQDNPVNRRRGGFPMLFRSADSRLPCWGEFYPGLFREQHGSGVFAENQKVMTGRRL